MHASSRRATLGRAFAARFIPSFLSALLALSVAIPAVAADSAATATVAGIVVDRSNALPIPAAHVILQQGQSPALSTSTDARGHFAIVVPVGIYHVTISAVGYASSESDDVTVLSGTTTLDTALRIAATTANGTLTTIGRTTSSAQTLSAATTISRQVSAEQLTSTGQLRVVDQLGTLPATNVSTSSSVGDDVSLDLRGFGADETAALLDGHPVGPLGVGSGGFNFSLGPAFGLSEVDVTYGSGAQGLFGSDTIGGAVNFITLKPTDTPQFLVQQQFGGFGILSTAASATGTFDKLGYAFALGRLGEYGDFFPGPIAQSARPDNVQSSSVNPNGACAGSTNDVSKCNLAVNTYNVSQNTEQTVGLAKLDYAISPVTHFKIATYGAVQWSDSTGNGDNDYLPYATRLKAVQSGATNCTTPSGVPGYTVVTNPLPSVPTTVCDTAQQFALATSGPDGGGDGRQRSTTMRDYDFTFTTKAGSSDLTVSAFDNNYVFWKDSSLAGGTSATGQGLGTPTYADFYNTQGYLFSDEITSSRNYLGLGYTLYHQLQDGNEDDISGVSPKIPTGYFGEGSVFARDTYTFNDRLSLFANAWLKHSSVTGQTTFDPRATLQVRPTSRDVVQVTYGRSDGAPSPQLKLVGAAQASDPGSSLTSVSCNGYNDVTSAGNPDLKAEAANDYEFGYGHRFNADSNLQLNGYVTTVADQLFSASEPLTQYGAGNVVFAPGALQTYLTRLQSQCPGANITAANIDQFLSVSTTYNAAHALVRGIELSGRQRFLKNAYIDYGYFIESSTKTGIADAILVSNPTVVNGAQLAGIPLHQATISLDVAPGPWEFRLDNYYVGYNNPLNRPAYWHSDAFVSRKIGRGGLVTLGGTNIFNNAVQDYGYIGFGTAPITNTVSQSSPAPSEEFGLAPAQFTLTLQERL
jgi:outer membrane receptor protein involved in Fe transport